MVNIISFRRGLLHNAALSAGVLVGAGAAAAAECGMTLEAETLPEAFVAPQDCEGTALTLVGPLEFDLGGQTVTCSSNDNPNVGIHLLGTGVRLRHGAVENCEVGVLVDGDGGHRLFRIEAHGNGEHVKQSGGFEVYSDDNRLWRVAARENGMYGVRLEGDRNVVRFADVSNNHGSGVIILGEDNTLARSTVNDNEDTNIAVVDHRIGQIGVRGNRILDNQANRGGIDGILVGTDDNLIRGNEANGNDVDGIEVSASAGGNRIIGNTALGNHAKTEVTGIEHHGADLEDHNIDCGRGAASNRWSDNTFATSHGDSFDGEIDGPACIR